MGKRGEGWHRCRVLVLCCFLFEDREDAVVVLAYMRDFLEDFLAPDRQPNASSAGAVLPGLLRLVERPIQIHGKAPPLAVVEPIEGQSGDDSH